MNPASKTLVFDWNCTLLDDIHAMHVCTNKLLESEGYQPMHIDAFRANYTVPFEHLYRNMGFTDVQIERLLSLENSAFHDHYEPMAHEANLREGAVDILTHAHANGVQSLILSNHIVDPIRVQLRRLEIEHLFDDVLAYADRHVQFKDMTKGERLRRFMVKHGLTPQQTIIVGDSVEEIQIAHEQDLIGVAITGGCVSEERLREENPHHVIHSLAELKPIMQERGFTS
jgi:phosphoglycolate phosphatase